MISLPKFCMILLFPETVLQSSSLHIIFKSQIKQILIILMVSGYRFNIHTQYKCN